MLSIPRLGILLSLLLGLPPFGLLLTGYSPSPKLTLFPISIEPGESSISWLIFALIAAIIIGILTPVIWRFFKCSVGNDTESVYPEKFSWWGWIAVLWVVGSWILAWNRFSWFASWQPHTFPLLWLGYIVTLNALTYQRSRQCLFLNRPRFLSQLFLLSAAFWWVFEYLNQYVNNWHYVNLPETSNFEYFLHTSLAFSTVLPAVLSTYEWLDTFPRFTKPFENWHSLRQENNKKLGWLLLFSGSIELGVIGVWPTILFPFLWLAPLGLLLSIQILKHEPNSITPLIKGDWRPMILSSLAALVCGFWWELWNANSLVHWEYTIPYVHAFNLFEMPLLGYAGYLPFGLICLAITELALSYQPNQQHKFVVVGNLEKA